MNGISTLNARLIRQGVEAGRLPHRNRAIWRIDGPYHPLTMNAFYRERLNAERYRISITIDPRHEEGTK